MAEKIVLFDSTLRDGAQAEGISFSVEDKIRILETLDRLGIDMIEAGNPGSNPKDIAFFEQIANIPLKHAKLCAFGSTRRSGIHVEDDCEHFFDGYKLDSSYAMEVLKAAERGGASSVALCDTNGGTLPSEVSQMVMVVKKAIHIPVGIHCHNDSGLGVANSLAAVDAGARQVQGTFLGYGERCGNANLSAIIPNLQLKMGYACLPEECLEKMTGSAIRIAEISNYVLSGREPFIGKSAFAHKGGMHIDAVLKAPTSFEHIPPESVGNERRILMSEVSGRSTIMQMIKDIDPSEKKSEETTRVMDRIKALEYEGYQFEGAESSVRLLIRKELGKYKPFFKIEDFKTFGEKPVAGRSLSSSAVVKVCVDGKEAVNAAEGDGPVNALDKALRCALEDFFPKIKEMRLTDFKVRVIDKGATASKVRVLIESTDGQDIWTNVGVSTDVIEASLIALVDALEYKLLGDMERQLKEYKLL